MFHAYIEDQLVEQPAIESFAELGSPVEGTPSVSAFIKPETPFTPA